MSNSFTLANLGWQPFFQHQLSLDDWNLLTPARVIGQHKSVINLATEHDVFNHPILGSMPTLVVGDWALVDEKRRFCRLLDRKTCFSIKAPGANHQTQLISANVDTAFIVCSMNEDFNLNRIERFLSVVNESGAEPVIVLSKSDLAGNPDSYVEQAQGIDNSLLVEHISCLDRNDVAKLSPWTKEGKTIAVLGSSGVGKSTLINTLLGEDHQSTGAIRESDEKGRHTTSSRFLILMKSGGVLLDTPGMREIQLADCKEGIAVTFSDIEELAYQCRYRDCQHQNEPGCAVQQAISEGKIEQRRLESYTKLIREEALNTATIAEKRSKEKALDKFYKRTMKDSRKLRGLE